MLNNTLKPVHDFNSHIIPGASDISKQYMGIVAMLVESYSLESASSIATLVSLVIRSPFGPFFLQCDIHIKVSSSNSVFPIIAHAYKCVLPFKVIAYLLVVYRVSTGRAWNKQTEEKISTLQWNNGAQSATGVTTTRTSQIPGTNIVVDPLPASHSVA